MMNDDNRFDELLRNAAQDYNRPPAEVPRDDMWAAIEAARKEGALRPLHIVSPAPHRRLPRYAWLGAAAAAVLLVATGVGIGRWSTSRVPAAGSSGKVGAVVSNRTGDSGSPIIPGNQPTASDLRESPRQGQSANETASAGSAAEAGSAIESRGGVTSGSRVASRPPEAGGSRAVRGSRGAADDNRVASRGPSASGRTYGMTYGNPPAGPRREVPYQVATIRHLANAEALLTAFRTDSRDAKMDAQLSSWARDLLSNTRLLLDSPAADDPQRARLLGDLELVLAQIVQLSPGTAAQDRELIAGSIRSGQVMTRLRSAIPAGPTRGL
jgi:hypothetical protein